jgi:hypothetical protein
MFDSLLGQYKSPSDYKETQTKSIINTVLQNSMKKHKERKVLADPQVRIEMMKRMNTFKESNYKKPSWRLAVARKRIVKDSSDIEEASEASSVDLTELEEEMNEEGNLLDLINT